MVIPLSTPSSHSSIHTAMDAMRMHLATGRWCVGDRLPDEWQLAEMLQVSPDTARQAVDALVRTKMLLAQQSGAVYVRAAVDAAKVVSRVGGIELLSHMELRRTLEIEAASRAARHRTTGDLGQLDALLQLRGAQHNATVLEDFVDRDVAFHVALAEAAYHPALEQLYRYLSGSMRVHLLVLAQAETQPDLDLALHQDILNAVRHQDPEAAAQATQRIFLPVLHQLRASADGCATDL